MESPANTTLLNAGTKCKADHCGLYDFLPYKCQFCSESYCSDHFRPAAHHCDKFVDSDRIAPPCPFCQSPISIKPNEDPNDAMETHFAVSCEVMLGSEAAARAKSKTPRCSRNKCGKVLYTPITCDSCHQQFCATHRHPDSHKCVTAAPTTNSSPLKSPAKASKQDLSERLRSGLNLGSSSPSPSSSSSASKHKPHTTPRPAAAAAVRKAPTPGTSLGKPAPTTVASTSGNSSKTPVHNPCSKVDRWVSPSSSSPSIPSPPTSNPPSPSVTSNAGMSQVQAVIDSNAQKPKPHLLFSSWSPPSLFGAA